MALHARRQPMVAAVRVAVVAAIGATGLAVLLASPARSPSSPVRELPFRQSDRVPAAIAARGDDFERATRNQRADPRPSTGPGSADTSTAASETPSRRASPTRSTSSPTPTISERTRIENEVVTLTNAERAAADCPALRNDERLREAARGHSEDMAERNYFGHDSPDGTTPWDRAKAAGYPDPSGENIAHGYPDAESVVEAWMSSAGHRANILNCDSRAIGVGVELDSSDGPYWTQMFGYS